MQARAADLSPPTKKTTPQINQRSEQKQLKADAICHLLSLASVRVWAPFSSSFFFFFPPTAQIRSWTEQQMLAGLQIWMDYSDEQMLPPSQPAVAVEQIEREALLGARRRSVDAVAGAFMHGENKYINRNTNKNRDERDDFFLLFFTKLSPGGVSMRLDWLPAWTDFLSLWPGSRELLWELLCPLMVP